jgi:hypothetical protein
VGFSPDARDVPEQIVVSLIGQHGVLPGRSLGERVRVDGLTIWYGLGHGAQGNGAQSGQDQLFFYIPVEGTGCSGIGGIDGCEWAGGHRQPGLNEAGQSGGGFGVGELVVGHQRGNASVGCPGESFCGADRLGIVDVRGGEVSTRSTCPRSYRPTEDVDLFADVDGAAGAVAEEVRAALLAAGFGVEEHTGDGDLADLFDGFALDMREFEVHRDGPSIRTATRPP